MKRFLSPSKCHSLVETEKVTGRNSKVRTALTLGALLLIQKERKTSKTTFNNDQQGKKVLGKTGWMGWLGWLG